jgi:hypothetical protein
MEPSLPEMFAIGIRYAASRTPGQVDPRQHRSCRPFAPERRVALFERLGGPRVGALARRRFIEGKLNAEYMAAWERLAFPVYT